MVAKSPYLKCKEYFLIDIRKTVSFMLTWHKKARFHPRVVYIHSKCNYFERASLFNISLIPGLSFPRCSLCW